MCQPGYQVGYQYSIKRKVRGPVSVRALGEICDLEPNPLTSQGGGDQDDLDRSISERSDDLPLLQSRNFE